MKKLIIFLFYIFISMKSYAGIFNETICFETDGQNIVFLPNDTTPYTGKYLCKHDNGLKKREGRYKNGKLDGTLTIWYENGQKWYEGNYKNGISEKELYSHFVHDNAELVEEMSGVWTFKFFSQALWDLVDNTKGWYYNQHKARLGNTKTHRRWLAYDSEKIQVRFVKITTDFDKEWMTSPDLQENMIDRSDGTADWFKEYDEAIN